MVDNKYKKTYVIEPAHIDKAMISATAGCQTMIDAGVKDLELIFAGGLTNFLITLEDQRKVSYRIIDTIRALREYADKRRN